MRMPGVVPIKVRPLLVSGMLATDPHGPVILVDSEQPPAEAARALWHEVAHLIGIADEAEADELARRLAAVCPDVLDRVRKNINVPDSQAPQLLKLSEARRDFERAYVHRLLLEARGNVSLAAEGAGRNRTEFYRLLRRHGIQPKAYRRRGES